MVVVLQSGLQGTGSAKWGGRINLTCYNIVCSHATGIHVERRHGHRALQSHYSFSVELSYSMSSQHLFLTKLFCCLSVTEHDTQELTGRAQYRLPIRVNHSRDRIQSRPRPSTHPFRYGRLLHPLANSSPRRNAAATVIATVRYRHKNRPLLSVECPKKKGPHHHRHCGAKSPRVPAKTPPP